MRIGDCVRWIGQKFNPEKNGKIGLIVDLGTDGRFFQVLWEDGTINGNIERQMMVVCRKRR